jgi:hypothetical protein
VSEDSLWTFRSARWLTALVIVLLAMGVVTYFYVLQEDAGESDESVTISLYAPPACTSAGIS